MKIIGTAFVCMLLAFGCGGGGGSDGSGVDPNVLLVEIEPDEAEAFCEYQQDLAGPPRTIECAEGEDIEVEPFDLDGCVDDLLSIGDEAPECPVTVGELETCFEDLAAFSDDELCDPEGVDLPASCEVLLDPDC